MDLSYYKYKEGFICPKCPTFVIDQSIFVSDHLPHVGNFTVSKKTLFLQCSSNSFYVWRRSREEIANYYRYKKVFICPECSTTESELDTFMLRHQHHAGAFLRAKKTYLPPINTIVSTPPPSTNMNASRKRQLGAGAVVTHRSHLNRHYVNLQMASDKIETSVVNMVANNKEVVIENLRDLNMDRSKIQIAAKCLFERQVNGEQETKEWYVSNCAHATHDDDYLMESAEKLDQKIAVYESLGSNWRIRRILQVDFILCKTSDLCYLHGRSYIPTPETLAKSKAIVNVQNRSDVLCFLYSILAVLKYNEIGKDYRQRASKYKEFLHLFQYKETDMPMKICDIPKFERQNPWIRINVLSYNNAAEPSKPSEVYKNPFFDLMYRSGVPVSDAVTTVTLLLLTKGETFHYTAVTNLNRLLNTNHLICTRIQNIWCQSCFLGFRVQQAYEKHLPLCGQLDSQATMYTMPVEKQLKFSDWHKSVSPAFVVYADFESVLEDTCDASRPQKHMPCAAAYILLNLKTGQSTYKSFFGEQCIVNFLASLEEEAVHVKGWYKTNSHQPMQDLRADQQVDFNNATECYICQQAIVDKVRDHDHFTGLYLGAACNSCNLARRLPKRSFLPVVFHNLRGYDMHHILKHAINKFTHWALDCIPQSSEKFLSLQANIKDAASLRFLDSLQFLNASLANLVKSMESLPLTADISNIPDDMKTAKAVFPYTYAKQIEDLERCTEPPKAFDSQDDYALFCESWKSLGCNNLKEYMMTYLQLDVYLLADVFETFRQTALEEDGLDPLNYYSIPGLSWSSALKSLTEALELLQDPTAYEFYEHGIRGGMTFVNKHRVQKDPSTDLLYIDINNLYGWSLTQKLPCKDFKWILDDDELNALMQRLPSMVTDGGIGYTFEVDLHTPRHLHDKLDQLPPAPESGYPPKSKAKKLLLTHEDKKNYIVHFALLQFYMSLGVEVLHVHRAIQFEQDYVFKTYVDGNSAKRAQATTKFSKDYYKLKNNSLYGKTVENIRKRKAIRLCNSSKRLVTYASKPTFKKTIEIADDLIACLMAKETVCLNRPVYIGQTVLDLSKLRMYILQYKELEMYRREFNCTIDIVAGDTDSFFLECKHVDVKAQLLPAMIRDQLLDTSNYATNHPLYSNRLANVVGKFKDESGGAQSFLDAVFLRPKLYSILYANSSPTMKNKGVNMRQCSLTHDDYLKELHNDDDDEQLYVKQFRIGSTNHQLYSFNTHKLALSRLDDKRHWLDLNRSLAYGHYSL